jgi:hypothetical protein
MSAAVDASFYLSDLCKALDNYEEEGLNDSW